MGKLGKEEEPAIERRRECTDLGQIYEKERDRRGMSVSSDVSLTIFITCMSGRKSLAPFAYRFFHYRNPLGLSLAFDVAERNGKFDGI